MKLTPLFTGILLATTTTVSAAPTAEPAIAEIEKRADMHVYACRAKNWGAPCANGAVTNNQCYTYETWAANNGMSGWGIGSFGPGNCLSCTWYSLTGCQGDSNPDVKKPGYGVIPGGWAFKIQSFRCTAVC